MRSSFRRPDPLLCFIRRYGSSLLDECHGLLQIVCLFIVTLQRPSFKNLYQDVVVSSPRPEPIDDTAGVRAAPPGREAPCAVQVRSRYGARDLMLPSHLTPLSDGPTPRSNENEATNLSPASGIAATTELRRTCVDKHLTIKF